MNTPLNVFISRAIDPTINKGTYPSEWAQSHPEVAELEAWRATTSAEHQQLQWDAIRDTVVGQLLLSDEPCAPVKLWLMEHAVQIKDPMLPKRLSNHVHKRLLASKDSSPTTLTRVSADASARTTLAWLAGNQPDDFPTARHEAAAHAFGALMDACARAPLDWVINEAPAYIERAVRVMNPQPTKDGWAPAMPDRAHSVAIVAWASWRRTAPPSELGRLKTAHSDAWATAAQLRLVVPMMMHSSDAPALGKNPSEWAPVLTAIMNDIPPSAPTDPIWANVLNIISDVATLPQGAHGWISAISQVKNPKVWAKRSPQWAIPTPSAMVKYLTHELTVNDSVAVRAAWELWRTHTKATPEQAAQGLATAVEETLGLAVRAGHGALFDRVHGLLGQMRIDPMFAPHWSNPPVRQIRAHPRPPQNEHTNTVIASRLTALMTTLANAGPIVSGTMSVLARMHDVPDPSTAPVATVMELVGSDSKLAGLWASTRDTVVLERHTQHAPARRRSARPNKM